MLSIVMMNVFRIFLLIGKKENIIKKGIEGKIHKVRNSEQTANRNK